MANKQTLSKVKTLIICIDRDNDLGEKINLKGPVIGERDCIKAGNALLLSDPEDTDSNSIFGAIKIKHGLKEKTEIVILTGDKDVGIKSDKELTRQLELVIKRFKPKGAVVVSDGAEDEYVLPIIQSRLPIISVRRVVVKQSEGLESSYYVIKDFIKYVSANPRLARVALGLPAIALLLLAIFGATGWRLIIGTTGLYLLIKGFQLENFFGKIINEVIISLKKSRVSFFLYIVSFVFFIIGCMFGYTKASFSAGYSWLTASLMFIRGSIFFFFIAAVFLWIEKVIMRSKSIFRYFPFLALIFAVSIVSYTATEFILESSVSFLNLIFSIILGFFALGITILIERIHRKSSRKNLFK